MAKLGSVHRLLFRLVRVGHVVADVVQREVLEAPFEVEPVIAQTRDGTRRLVAHLGLVEEMKRRRQRRFEEQPLHGRVTFFGPVRNEHQRHRRPVLVLILVVLPLDPARRKLIERVHQGEVLGSVGLALVPRVVPLHPSGNERHPRECCSNHHERPTHREDRAGRHLLGQRKGGSDRARADPDHDPTRAGTERHLVRNEEWDDGADGDQSPHPNDAHVPGKVP